MGGAADSELAFRSHRLSIAEKVKEKLRDVGKWHNLSLDWSAEMNRYLISAQEIVFHKDYYLRLTTIVPFSYLDSIECKTLIYILNEDKEIEKSILPDKDAGSSPCKVKHEFVIAILGADNQVVLNSVSFGLPKS